MMEKTFYQNIDDYHSHQPLEFRAQLNLLRRTILKAAPDAVENYQLQYARLQKKACAGILCRLQKTYRLLPHQYAY